MHDKKLRKGIDHTGVSVVYFCHDGKGNFIMAKRSVNSRDEHGRWDIGGGAVDFGDSPEDTVRREIKEEYNVDVISMQFLGFRDVHRILEDGSKTHWIALDHKVLVNPEGMKIGEPHKFEDIGWFSLPNMPEPVHTQFPIFLKLYKGKL